MYVATDCIVFGFDSEGIKLLLFRRRVDPGSGSWSLIGSFLRLEEGVEEAARRVLHTYTGLQNVFLEQLRVYGAVDRDPGYRCISVAQYALIPIDRQDVELVQRKGAVWFALDQLPELCLDHGLMVRDALSELRRTAQLRPIGFELLPEKFTLPQLIRLYEEIYRKPIDPRNFRKKIHSLGILTKLSEKDKSASRKGAWLYRFDRDNYRRLLESGFSFQL